MGFPLNRGSLCDGTLTGHWHHARVDLLEAEAFCQIALLLHRCEALFEG